MTRRRHIPAGFLRHDDGAITAEGRPMRSLWRILALQWLGGEGSEALTGDSTILEGLLHGRHAQPIDSFDVRREPQVSRQAIMTSGPERPIDPEIPMEAAWRSAFLGRYSR
jgi:hypothetical protein